MSEEDGGHEQAGKRNPEADALHEDARAAECRARDILADKSIDDDTNDLRGEASRCQPCAQLETLEWPRTHGVRRGDDEVGGQHRPVKQPGLAHL